MFHTLPAINCLIFLKLARPWETSVETKRALEEIQKRCNTCQNFSYTPIIFKVSLPNSSELNFSDEFSIDLMFLDSNAVLHNVDTDTHFYAARFLDPSGELCRQSVDGISLAFVQACCTSYTGFLDRLRTDLGSVFTSDRWKKLTNLNGIEARLSSVGANRSLGIGERLYEPLRRFHWKMRNDYPYVSGCIALELASKTMNGTIGENGPVPTCIIFGIIARFPIISTQFHTQEKIWKLLLLLKQI